MNAWLRKILARIGGRLPVKIVRGLSQGMWWSAYPHSAYWRTGGTSPQVEAAVRKHGCSPGQSSWDLGAHFGIYTLGMARAVGTGGQVVAVEPDPVSFRRMRRHVEMNRLSKVVVPIEAGASDQNALLPMHFSEGEGATTSHFFYEDEPRESGQNIGSIRTIALGDLVSAGTIRAPEFVKIDVEGHGGRALQGFQDVVAKHHPTFLMGFHGEQELRMTERVLRPLGYQLENLDGESCPWETTEYLADFLIRPSLA